MAKRNIAPDDHLAVEKATRMDAREARPEVTARRSTALAPLDQPWSQTAEQVLDALGVARERGLDDGVIRRRRKLYGANALRRTQRRSAWRILLDQLASLMVALLAAAAIVAFVLVDWVEGAAIAAVIAINTAIGFFTELEAAISMDALYRLGQVEARVRRDGRIRQVPADELVPGDIVIVEGGDVVTADLRLLEASRLQTIESALTGESVPVGKSAQPVAADASLAERTSMLYKGTAITRGSGEAVAVATGLASELGRIASLVHETDSGSTPIERRLEALGRRLIGVTLGVAALLFGIGVAAGRELSVMLETTIALAVATVPEGLPVVATLALARGMWRMARHNALINRLSAVETLGATGVICTDKTGTLTENRMHVACLSLPAGDFTVDGRSAAFESDGGAVDPAQNAALREAIEVGVLCNNAEWQPSDDGEGKAVGDPTEVALLAAGAAANIHRADLAKEEPEIREEAFDTETRMMATFHRHGDRHRIAVKGAPEAVLAACTRLRSDSGEDPLGDRERQRWLDRNHALAADGLRMLALAARETDSSEADPYEDLVFLGLVGLVDPPREKVREAIAECRAAGIEVVMVTGDQPATAGFVARAVGLVDEGDAPVVAGSEIRPPGECTEDEQERLRRARIFARVSPEQKLDLIALHQHAGSVVAMTGDGVNDAPALKKADIGVAMGKRGTQVAREAADMVLTDDAFDTIVVAVRQGRIIFSNLRTFVLYLLSCNVSEVLVVAIATVAGAPLPILPLQILFLNLVTDVFPALALGVGPGDPGVMRHEPRPSDEAILEGSHWAAIAGHGALITAATLGAFALALSWLELGTTAAVTISFLTLALAQLWHVFNMRSPESSLLANDIVGNRWVWAALVSCLALLAAAVYVPPLAAVLRLVSPDLRGWGVILACSSAPLLLGQLQKSVRAPTTEPG